MRKLTPTKRLPNVPAQSTKRLKSAGRKVKLPKVPALAPVARFLRKIGRLLGKLVPPYFKNAWAELRLVAWPNRRETRKLSYAVFSFSFVFGLLVFGIDKGLDEVFKHLILR